MEAQNAFAGQGPVLLDIGDDVGALIVDMPAELTGVEIEIRAVASGGSAGRHHDHVHPHVDGYDHPHHPHVAVVARPTSAGVRPSLVFGELLAGDYELHERTTGTDGPPRLRVTVDGGKITEARWPG